MDVNRMSMAASQVQTNHQATEIMQQYGRVEDAAETVQQRSTVETMGDTAHARNDQQEKQHEQALLQRQQMEQQAQPYLGGSIDVFV
ncbi:hypothetical protein [Alkalicoccus urumqiensis]|uniref:Uncharacterized protein n=1 Tax=Alkalicoccus urumqiensis TaxID=1548213 RepID=A0A2P6MH78_ALKUR|nr:hypothetical protein [Alkalicoccus urumqiensis]PRO65637.1 hypothetical protein C6I21_08935 [Alkalicoccus urumqiensis]